MDLQLGKTEAELLSTFLWGEVLSRDLCKSLEFSFSKYCFAALSAMLCKLVYMHPRS